MNSYPDPNHQYVGFRDALNDVAVHDDNNCPLNNKKKPTNVDTPINKGANHVITESTLT
jgi:hypothetical protein